MTCFPRTSRLALFFGLILLSELSLLSGAESRGMALPSVPGAVWWKGNLHTHTLWSDGDDFPEMVADWYKNHGYHFLGLSDHNLLQRGEKWVTVTNLLFKELTVDRYRTRWGNFWVQTREQNGREQVRLKTFDEFRPMLEEKGKFLLIPATEITGGYKIWPVHVNASNIQTPLSAPYGESVFDVMQGAVNQVLQQRAFTGQPMIPHINHPNFGWALTAEDIARLRGEHFFEVYNGHPDVHNFGDGTRAGTEKIWDVVLALRLSQPASGLGILFALAVDDSHRYHEFGKNESNPGRGWIMIRSLRLESNELIRAMERGDFYSSTGVRLLDVQRDRHRLTVQVDPEPGVTYTIRFIGTPRGFNSQSIPIIAHDGRPYATTRHYSSEVGKVLREVYGTSASYESDGSELYVRAKVISSKLKEDAQTPDERQMAWTQPAVLAPN